MSQPRMRMVWWREVRWLLASYLFGWMIKLTKHEAPREMLVAIHELATLFDNDPKFDTVRMQEPRR